MLKILGVINTNVTFLTLMIKNYQPKLALTTVLNLEQTTCFKQHEQ